MHGHTNVQYEQTAGLSIAYYRYWNLILLKGMYLVRPLSACMPANVYRDIVLNLFANPCSRFVNVIRSSFLIYTCLGNTLERAPVGSGKGR
jgi:hypothetical protein